MKNVFRVPDWLPIRQNTLSEKYLSMRCSEFLVINPNT